jgi:hypothetical protein
MGATSRRSQVRFLSPPAASYADAPETIGRLSRQPVDAAPSRLAYQHTRRQSPHWHHVGSARRGSRLRIPPSLGNQRREVFRSRSSLERVGRRPRLARPPLVFCDAGTSWRLHRCVDSMAERGQGCGSRRAVPPLRPPACGIGSLSSRAACPYCSGRSGWLLDGDAVRSTDARLGFLRSRWLGSSKGFFSQARSPSVRKLTFA